MIFAENVTVSLTVPWLSLPFRSILMDWENAEFDPSACAAMLTKAALQYAIPDKMLRPGAIQRGEVVWSDECLFRQCQTRELVFLEFSPDDPRRTGTRTGQLIELPLDEVGAASSFIKDAFSQKDSARFIEQYSFSLGQELVERLVQRASRFAQSWPAVEHPGLYRREHASVVIRSRQASLLFDPLSPQVQLPNLARLPVPGGDIDAILITHMHPDHWDLPSLLAHSRGQVPIYVPRVPRPNLLCPVDPQHELGLCDLPGRAVDWGETLRIGDMDIDVLPFFGEQPTRDDHGTVPGVRNWGNCYRVNTPDFSALLLADAGDDPMGSAVEVARQSFAKRGPVDFVLACSRIFPCPFFQGQPFYWAPLPFASLRHLFALHRAHALPSTTAGAAGIAEICDAIQARFFLPYANGFEGLGVPVSDTGWGHGDEPSEAHALVDLRRALAERGSKTQVVAWNSGDHVELRGRDPLRIPYSGRE